MKKVLAILLVCALTVCVFAACTKKEDGKLKVGVFYYDVSDAYISSVRTALSKGLDALDVEYKEYDGAANQSTQDSQIIAAIEEEVGLLIVNIVETSSDDAAQHILDAAKTAGIPIVFFNREVSDSIVNSYEKCAFVGTDPAEAGHMQGEMIGEYLVENFDSIDRNGDGKISYVMFKGQEGNAEAEYRTQYGVEDTNKVLAGDSKPPLEFYDAKNTSKFLVDPTNKWSAAAANDYMTTILTEYNDANNNMLELVIANNDAMAEGAISALMTAGYNTGAADGKAIPVYGVDATASAQQLIAEGKMTGTVKQDAEGMATAIAALVKNIADGAQLMANTSNQSYKVDDDAAKIRIPYQKYTGK